MLTFKQDNKRNVFPFENDTIFNSNIRLNNIGQYRQLSTSIKQEKRYVEYFNDHGGCRDMFSRLNSGKSLYSKSCLYKSILTIYATIS